MTNAIMPFQIRLQVQTGGIYKSTLGELIVAKTGAGYFDRKGHFFKSAREATASDLAALLGQISDGESLAPGIALMLMERRTEVERLFAEHDEMVAEEEAAKRAKLTDIYATVAKLPSCNVG
jgi:hypothetical protein